MRQTIGNPLSWGVRKLRELMHGLGNIGSHIGGIPSASTERPPEIRDLQTEDIEFALRHGFDDFTAMRSDAVFLILVYPIIGIAIAAFALQDDFVQLLYPAVTGFALVGPLAAIGLYEISKRREAGQDPSWFDAFAVFRLSTIGSILLLGFALVLIFAIWIATAQAIYALTLGPEEPDGLWSLIGTVFTTPAGWALFIIGTGVGALFAVLVLAISVMSFPLLVDRDTTLAYAVLTSVRVTLHNPGVIFTWGAVVAILLFLGALPLFFGMIIVLPVLGHATWHLYRRAVVAEPASVPAGDARAAGAERPVAVPGGPAKA
jgi:uncharacterized membrane protein